MAIGIRTLGMRIDCIVTTKGNVNESSLVGIHRRE